MAGDQSTYLPDLRKGYLCTHPSSEQIYHDVFCTHMSECLRKLAQAVKQPCMYLIFSYSAQSKGMNCLVLVCGNTFQMFMSGTHTTQ